MNENKEGFRLNARYAPDKMKQLCNAALLASRTYGQIYDGYSTNYNRTEVAFGFLLGVAYSLMEKGKELSSE